MALSDLLIGFFGSYQIPLIFFGSFFFGDTVILSLAVLSAQGVISIYLLILFGFLGTILSDTIWFYAGSYLLNNKSSFKEKVKKYDRLISSVNRITGKRPFLFLLFAKFMYGTRIFFIAYLSIKKLRYPVFLLFDALGTMIWLFALTMIGWLAGKGITNLIPILKKGEYLLTTIILLAIIMRVATGWISKRIAKGSLQ